MTGWANLQRGDVPYRRISFQNHTPQAYIRNDKWLLLPFYVQDTVPAELLRERGRLRAMRYHQRLYVPGPPIAPRPASSRSVDPGRCHSGSF